MPAIPTGTNNSSLFATGGRDAATSSGRTLDSAQSRFLAFTDQREESMLPAQLKPPLLMGWLPADMAPPLVTVSGVDRSFARVLVRSPVTIVRNAVGENVKVDAPFTKMLSDAASGLPYDNAKHRWLSSDISGRRLIGFDVPAQMGVLRCARATLWCDVLAPRHTVRFLRDQCKGGKPIENSEGRQALVLNGPIQPASFSLECESGDCDPAGRVWLLMEVARRDDAGPVPVWHVRKLAATLQGVVVAPPSD